MFGIDDAIGATIQCIRDGNWGQFGEKIKSNFANSWAFFGLKMTSPGSWLELGVSALAGFGLSAFMGPIGWAVGLFTPAFNFLIGYSAIEGFGGEIIPSSGLSGHLTINIQIPGMGSENAATFGNLVIGGSGLNNVIAHERGHFLQSLLLGPLYWMVIAIPSITRAGIWNYRLMNGKSVKSYGSFYTEKWADKWSIP
ncbi:MAG: hypothetical protein LBQ14_08060 [Treponema sp.]|nr:hypothetical protein [Treponema sp.]